MDKEYSDDLLEDLEALTDLHLQFISVKELSLKVIAFYALLLLNESASTQEAVYYIEEGVKAALETYKEGLENER